MWCWTWSTWGYSLQTKESFFLHCWEVWTISLQVLEHLTFTLEGADGGHQVTNWTVALASLSSGVKPYQPKKTISILSSGKRENCVIFWLFRCAMKLLQQSAVTELKLKLCSNSLTLSRCWSWSCAPTVCRWVGAEAVLQQSASAAPLTELCSRRTSAFASNSLFPKHAVLMRRRCPEKVNPSPHC